MSPFMIYFDENTDEIDEEDDIVENAYISHPCEVYLSIVLKNGDRFNTKPFGKKEVIFKTEQVPKKFRWLNENSNDNDIEFNLLNTLSYEKEEADDFDDLYTLCVRNILGENR